MSRVRERWVYRTDPDTGEVIKFRVDPDHRQPPRVEIGVEHYEGLRATDGTDISSKAKHREYMRVNGLTTADDYRESWAKAAEKRAEFYTRGGDAAEHKERRDQISRAIYELGRQR